MPSRFRRPFIGLVLGLASLGVTRAPAQQTRPERTGGRETSTYVEVGEFVDSLVRQGADIRLGVMGESPQGRPLRYVIAARPMVDGPGDAHRSGKPVIYIQGNIHAGEVEGKEAAQMLLRDLTVGPLRSLLDSVILLVVPVYNADGNEQFGPGDQNRRGQNGPAIVGRRPNGQGLDLNRDYVKLEAPETRAAYALLDRWAPDLFIDLHTTNGSYHGYALTWSPGLNPNSPPANDYVRDHFLPTVRQRLRKRHRLETFPYGNFRNQEPDSLTQGWETYDPFPRYGTNALGMTGRMAILSEAYSNDPFSRRIEATYLFVREILSLVAEERVAVKRVVASSAGWRPDSVTIQSVLAAPVEQEVIAEITEADGGGSHGFARRRRTGVFKTIRMPVFDRFAARQKVARPAAYLLPPQHAHLVALLHAQGVVVGRLTAPWNGTAEAFAVDSIAVARYVFEGHRTVSVTGAWHEREASADPGWFVVSTDQRLGVLASYLLEPGSEDGFTTWNLLDRELRRGSDAPVLRVRSPILTPTILVE